MGLSKGFAIAVTRTRLLLQGRWEERPNRRLAHEIMSARTLHTLCFLLGLRAKKGKRYTPCYRPLFALAGLSWAVLVALGAATSCFFDLNLLALENRLGSQFRARLLEELDVEDEEVLRNQGWLTETMNRTSAVMHLCLTGGLLVLILLANLQFHSVTPVTSIPPSLPLRLVTLGSTLFGVSLSLMAALCQAYYQGITPVDHALLSLYYSYVFASPVLLAALIAVELQGHGMEFNQFKRERIDPESSMTAEVINEFISTTDRLRQRISAFQSVHGWTQFVLVIQSLVVGITSVHTWCFINTWTLPLGQRGLLMYTGIRIIPAFLPIALLELSGQYLKSSTGDLKESMLERLRATPPELCIQEILHVRLVLLDDPFPPSLGAKGAFDLDASHLFNCLLLVTTYVLVLAQFQLAEPTKFQGTNQTFVLTSGNLGGSFTDFGRRIADFMSQVRDHF